MEQLEKNYLKVKITFFIICILSIVGVFSYYFISHRSDELRSDYNQEIELEYWMKKSILVDEVTKFMESTSPGTSVTPIVVVNACDEYDVDVRFVLAQGVVESHLGTKGLAARTNSPWNIGACDGYKEDDISSKYKYDHPDQAVRPYLKVLTTRYLVTKSIDELLNEFTDANGNRYATYPHYEEEIKSYMTDEYMKSLNEAVSEYNRAKLRIKKSI